MQTNLTPIATLRGTQPKWRVVRCCTALYCRAAENPGCMTAADWREFLSGRGYTAGVGEPMALFYKEVRQTSIHRSWLYAVM